MFLKPAALEGYVFDGWYLTYEAGGPGEQGAYSDRVNYLPRDFAPESGEGIKLYGKLREFNINYDLVHEFNEAAELEMCIRDRRRSHRRNKNDLRGQRLKNVIFDLRYGPEQN